MDWVMTILTIVLLLILRTRSRPKWLWAVCAGLAFIAGAGLIETWVSDAVVGSADGIGGLVGASSSVTMGAAMLILVVIAGFDVAGDHKLDTRGIVALLLLPILFRVGDGPLAEAGDRFATTIHDAGTGLLSNLIGA